MLKYKKKRIIWGIALTAIFSSIAWTNESIDYLTKLGFQNINPAYVLLVTTLLATISLSWLMWEILN